MQICARMLCFRHAKGHQEKVFGEREVWRPVECAFDNAKLSGWSSNGSTVVATAYDLAELLIEMTVIDLQTRGGGGGGDGSSCESSLTQ